MARTTYYFSHDGDASQDPKIQALIATYGMEGYGRYWRLIEMLFNQENYRLMRTQYVRNALAYAWACDSNAAQEFLDALVHEFELIRANEEFYWSESLLKRMEIYEEKATAKSQSARKAANARWQSPENTAISEKPDAESSTRNADAMRTQCETMQKGKGKIKEKVKLSISSPNGEDSPKQRSDSPSPSLYELPVNKNGSYFSVRQEDISKWETLYPAVDIHQELRNMFGWLDSNPTKRKTAQGMPAFINRWLAKEQDRGGSRQKEPASASSKKELAGDDLINEQNRLDWMTRSHMNEDGSWEL